MWVIFNGEIYNYRELRRELQGKGHQFKTNSDTEVIVHGYKEWGTHVFDRLNGMFGLAIWDARNQRLTLSRPTTRRLKRSRSRSAIIFSTSRTR